MNLTANVEKSDFGFFPSTQALSQAIIHSCCIQVQFVYLYAAGTPDLQHILTFSSHQILLFDTDIPRPITYGKTDLEKKLQAIT